jgi:hypothetical protein
MQRRSLALDHASSRHLADLSKALGVSWSAVVRLAVSHFADRFQRLDPHERATVRDHAQRTYTGAN